MADVTESSAVPPYVSFVSFTSLLDWLREEGVPAQLDRSIWDKKFSGSVGAQLMTSLRYLDLLDEETPTQKLEGLVSSEENDRKEILKGLLEEAYPSLFRLELSRATPKMLEDAFADIAGTAETRRKAVAFFINACKFAEIPLSSAVKKKARNRRAGATAKQRKDSNSKQVRGPTRDRGETSDKQTAGQPSNQSLRKLVLSSGGSLTLTLDVNVFELNRHDRDFVMELVDRVQSYESESDKQEDKNGEFA